jgi:hypothetical protein
LKPGAWLLPLALAFGCASNGTVLEKSQPTPAPRAPRAAAEALSGTARSTTSPPKSRHRHARPSLPWRENCAYAVGERLTFAVQYFNVTAGYATLSVAEQTTQTGKACYHIVAEARTHPFFETFFKVRDRIESFVDTQSLVPWRYEKHLREGGFSADSYFVYDQLGHQLVDDRGHSVTMAAQAQDVLSCFYLFRTLPDMRPGASAIIPVTADDKKSYEVLVKVLRREKVQVLAGSFNCLVVQPLLKFQSVFEQKGDVLLWVTDDERRLPVKISSKIVIGSIQVQLQSADWVRP